MSVLNIKVHNKQSASINDDNDLNIGESKWDFLFEFLLEHVESIYFWGTKLKDIDDEFDKLVFSLYEDILLDDGDPPNMLLFKVDKSSITSSRDILSLMWNYYEYPTLIFSYYDTNQDQLIEIIDIKYHPEEIASSIKGITLVYPYPMSIVLKIQSSPDMPDLNFLKNL